jgi:hypothetical protein
MEGPVVILNYQFNTKRNRRRGLPYISLQPIDTVDISTVSTGSAGCHLNSHGRIAGLNCVGGVEQYSILDLL